MESNISDITNHITWPWFSVTKHHLTCLSKAKSSPKVQYTVEMYFYTVEGGEERMAHGLKFL